MKIRTKLSRIFSFIKSTPNIKPKQISSALGIKPGTVSSAISSLRRRNIATKPKKDQTVRIKKTSQANKLSNIEQASSIQFRRKITKASLYCESKGTKHKGDSEMLFAITYEDNDISRFREEIVELELETDARGCFNPQEAFGYDDSKTTFTPPFTWPEIRVETEV